MKFYTFYRCERNKWVTFGDFVRSRKGDSIECTFCGGEKHRAYAYYCKQIEPYKSLWGSV